MTVLLDLLDRVALWLARIGAAGTVLALIAMMLHICADALSRWLFHAPIAGTLEIVSYYYMTAVVFLALALVQRAREHIKVEIFAKLLPARLVRVFDLLAALLTAIFATAFAVASVQEALRETAKGSYVDVIFYDLPTWQSFWIMAFGGVLISLATIVSFLDDVFRPETMPHPETPETTA